ncbi:hypothetical protein CC1G_03909 [Coprinopsis cinerea okayama7|uniref:Prokaryotic-type class I peptide chain release factors domain-containing protein n=1 Tax=Coprinopsis cinerea (strain Okayama-7 / 130 / ATCC MYA-4618 / FGSC 9003) TaxID=240176 RepID=A8NH63_COPC7|nr:hypothetical protein CC1G_03909 [Coprinopsis cinerea okayama7\|eukprot:XP_001833692.1 hypothetical protein CC1G_03909 [Coprinopsis cinerea okayama7\
MTITPALRASARSAYRDLWRAASVTFRGDEPVLQAFRQKMRNDAIAAAQTANDAASYEQHTALFKDIATVLRKNIVQAAKVRQLEDGTDIYHVNIREETELGDNESIKSPPPIPPRRSKREASNAAPAEEHPSSPPSTKRMSYSALKRAHTQRIVPELKEEDLEESFVRGSGPGGQSINKTENNVQLLHKPTGIRVSCQETRSLSQNRKIARKRLLEKLDKLANPGLSKEEMKLAKKRERERQRRKKAKKKALAKEVNAEVEER